MTTLKDRERELAQEDSYAEGCTVSVEELLSQIQESIDRFGTPFLNGSSNGHRRESLARVLEKLLYEELPDQLIEVNIRPENADGHHWEIEHHILAPDAGGELVRAAGVGRKDHENE